MEMSKMTKCCFAGHRCAPQRLLKEIISAIEDLIQSSDQLEFYSGGMGDFDKMCEQAVREMKKKYPEKEIYLYLVLPSYQYAPKNEERQYMSTLFDDVFVCDASDGSHPKAMIGKRNRWLVEQSDVMIAYVKHENGGAYSTLKYAQRQNLKIICIGMES